MADDLTATAACQINKNGHEFAAADGFLALKNYNNANDYYDVVAVTESTDVEVVGTISVWAHGSGLTTYVINGTSLRVCPNVVLTTSSEFKFLWNSDWSIQTGSMFSTAHNANTKYQSSTLHNIKVSTAGTYDLYLNTNKYYYLANQSTNTNNVYTTIGATAGDIFLNLNDVVWTRDNARFAAYFYNNSTDVSTWVDLNDTNSDGFYEGNFPANVEKYSHIIFCRMNGSKTANNWDNKWNQTEGDSKVALKGYGSTMYLSDWDAGTLYQ